MTVMTVTTRIEERQGKTMTKDKFVYRVEVESMKDWYEVLIEVRNKMRSNNRTKLALCYPSTDKGRRTRKMRECIFKNTCCMRNLPKAE